MNQPLVSIVIPVYNGADYMREAIDSALGQTWSNIEVVVVNDGSTDDGATEKIALSYGDRIRYEAKPNGGVATALNRGIEIMNGQYMSWLSHDDVYYPNKVARQVESLGDHPADAVLYSDYDVIDEKSTKTGSMNVPQFDPSRFRLELIQEPFLHGCTTLIPRSHFDEVGVFSDSLPTTQDYDLWFRMARRFPFIHIGEALVQSRHHANQGTRMINNADELNALYVRALDDLTEEELDSYGSAADTFCHLALALRRRRRSTAADHAMTKAVEASSGAAQTLAMKCRYNLAAVQPLYWAYRIKESFRTGS